MEIAALACLLVCYTEEVLGADIINIEEMVTTVQITHFDIVVGRGGLFTNLLSVGSCHNSTTTSFLCQGWHPARHAWCRKRLNVGQNDNRKTVHMTRTINSSALTSRMTAGGYGRGARVRMLVPSRILPDASLWKPTAAVERSRRWTRCELTAGTVARVGDGGWMRLRVRRSSPVSVCLLTSRGQTRGLVGSQYDTPTMVNQDLYLRVCVCMWVGVRVGVRARARLGRGGKISPQPILPLPLRTYTFCTSIQYPFVYSFISFIMDLPKLPHLCSVTSSCVDTGTCSSTNVKNIFTIYSSVLWEAYNTLEFPHCE